MCTRNVICFGESVKFGEMNFTDLSNLSRLEHIDSQKKNVYGITG